jgi:hypothetical protein
MADFRPGDVLWRIGAGVPDLGVERLGRYEVADFDPVAPVGLQLVGVPGLWSTKGWLLLSRRPAH